MSTTTALHACRVAVAAMLLALAGCASVPPAAAPDAGTIVDDTLALAGKSHPAHWHLPAGDASALLVLQHGFARRCANLRETTRLLVNAGLAVLCVDAPMAPSRSLTLMFSVRIASCLSLVPSTQPLVRHARA